MEQKFETLIQGILDEGYATDPHFFDLNLVRSLRSNLQTARHEGLMHPAGIGKHFSFQKNLKVRGDLIRWIDEENPAPTEQVFVAQVQAFTDYLNRTCYTGINGMEFHYAFYEKGGFYRRHKDQFKHDSGRKFSMVSYLNEDWQPSDGGELVLYLDGREVTILPEAGRVVFFKADEIEHEVKEAKRDRMSVAGWLLRL